MKYKVIYADPPWCYRNAGCRGAAENQYATMSVDEICQLPIQNFTAEDCVLLLWCTWPQMEEGLRVLHAWGFKYVTGFPWIKTTEISQTLWGKIKIRVPYGVGFWTRGCSEYVLIGTKGKTKPPTEGFIGLLTPNLTHSRKPDSLYHYATCLDGPYLELFARRKREGWDSWGNEIESDIVMGRE